MPHVKAAKLIKQIGAAETLLHDERAQATLRPELFDRGCQEATVAQTQIFDALLVQDQVQKLEGMVRTLRQELGESRCQEATANQAKEELWQMRDQVQELKDVVPALRQELAESKCQGAIVNQTQEELWLMRDQAQKLEDAIQILRQELDQSRCQEMQLQQSCALKGSMLEACDPADPSHEEPRPVQNLFQELQEVAKTLSRKNEELQLQGGSMPMENKSKKETKQQQGVTPDEERARLVRCVESCGDHLHAQQLEAAKAEATENQAKEAQGIRGGRHAQANWARQLLLQAAYY